MLPQTHFPAPGVSRRDALRHAGLTALASVGLPLAASTSAAAAEVPATRPSRGDAPLKITRVRPILTAPQSRVRMVVVKVETSEPGLYGLGCATFNQRPLAVKTAVEEYLDPFCRGRDANNIEDIWQTAHTSSYWRNGPVLNNALSGLDQALWDIKGKRAGMPVYQLLGGKARFAVDCYSHASGRDIREVVDNVKRLMEQGYRHIRIQLGGYGSPQLAGRPAFQEAGFGLPVDGHMDPGAYVRAVPRMFEAVARGLRGKRPPPSRHSRAHRPHRRHPPLQGSRAVPPVLRRGPLLPRGRRLVPNPSLAVQRPARDGRALQQSARMDRADFRTPHRLHPRPPFADRRAHSGAKARRAL